MRAEDLLISTPAGLFCPPGGFHIDPLHPVDRALITHGHADHARAGHGAVLATAETLEIMAIRHGPGFAGSVQAAEGNVQIGDVRVAFHPAGHVRGSAQIEIDWRGFRAVVTGDYCRQPNPVAAPFALRRCELMVTEATFGLPVFRHPDPMAEIGRLLASCATFPDRPHLVGCYALGKAQRLIALLRAAGHEAPILIHGSLARLCDWHAERGVRLGELRPATVERGRAMAGQIVLAPPSAFATTWVQRFRDPVIAFASGWMAIRARARQRGCELPLVISDHADWPDLTRTIAETGATEVWVTHGREEALVRWCALNGIAARPLRLVGYGEDADEAGA
jgi:putative mRNA 3-end processing factor